MHCRQFRQSHNDFVDGQLSDQRISEMYEHLQGCERCSRFDTAIRRGLLVARNLPTIQPSGTFRSRLDARLREPIGPAQGPQYTRLVTRAGAALAIVVVLALAGDANRFSPRAPAPASHTTRVAGTSASGSVPAQFLASFVSGIPVWPGVALADRVASHLAQVELRQPNAVP
jgi:anti-sigma factor RsiW